MPASVQIASDDTKREKSAVLSFPMNIKHVFFCVFVQQISHHPMFLDHLSSLDVRTTEVILGHHELLQIHVVGQSHLAPADKNLIAHLCLT